MCKKKIKENKVFLVACRPTFKDWLNKFPQRKETINIGASGRKNEQ